MRRWEDKGVVQDSDEEEQLGLDAFSEDELAVDAGDLQRSLCENHAPAPEPIFKNLRQNRDDGIYRQHIPQQLQYDVPPHTPSTSRSKCESDETSTLHERDGNPSPEASNTLTSVPLDDVSTSRKSKESPPRKAQATDLGDFFSLRSSPLSNPPASLPSPTGQEAPLPSPITPGHAMVIVHDVSQEMVAFEEDQQTHEVPARNSRNLRHRNPIQLHPYLLENEAYRRTLRGRGVRPIHVAQETQQDSLPCPETLDEHQSQSSQFVLSSSPQPSSPAQVHPSQGNVTSVRPVDENSDELPEFETLIRRARAGELRIGHKRRKTGQISRLNRLHTRLGSSSVQEEDDRHTLAMHSIQAQSAETTAGEAVQAENHPRRRKKKKFRPPPTLGEESLPTPATSSEVSVHEIHRDEITSESESDAVRKPQRTEPRLAGSVTPMSPKASMDPAVFAWSSSDSEAPQRNEEPMFRVQRRMRGVLPASWLRLDRQVDVSKRNPKSDAAENRSSPEKSPAKGVARRVTRKHLLDGPIQGHKEQPHEEPFEIMDESDHSLNPSAQAQGAVSSMLIDDYGFGGWPEDDARSVIEEDFVDPMIPPPSRSKRDTHRKSSSRQTRLDESFNQPHEKLHQIDRVGKSQPSKRDLSRQKPRKRKALHRKQWVRRKRPPRLNVLDAPDVASTFKTPDFVKVAKRQARRKVISNRDDPTRKIISLQTQQDGDDVDAVFRDWRAGRIKRQRPARNMQRSQMTTEVTAGTASRHEGEALAGERDRHVRESYAHENERKMLKDVSRRAPRRTLPTVIPFVQLQPTDNPLRPTSPAHGQKNQQVTHRLHPCSPSLSDRQGQLEESQHVYQGHHPHQAFHANIRQIGRQLNPRLVLEPQQAAAPMERFLAEPPQFDTQTPDEAQDEAQDVQQETCARRRRPRKRQPLYVHQAQLEPHRPYIFEPDPELVTQSNTLNPIERNHNVRGLLPFGSSYTVDFGIAPLPAGVCFRSNTFIGSGEFCRALSFANRDLDEPAGYTHIVDDGITAAKIGPWSEQTAEYFKNHLQRATTHVDMKRDPGTSDIKETQDEVSRASMTLRSLIGYLSNHLSFQDSIDRGPFVAASASAIQESLGHWQECPPNRSFAKKVLAYVLVIAVQIFKIAQHPTVSYETRNSAQLVVSKTSHELTSILFKERDSSVLDFHSPLNIRRARENGIGNTEASIEGIVITFHSLKFLNNAQMNFWKLIGPWLFKRIPNDCDDIQVLEGIWHELLAILPLLEIDDRGLLKPGSRRDAETMAIVDCGIAKDLMSYAFRLVSLSGNSPDLNTYVRAVLVRCFRLIRLWGWATCENLLGCAYDFFAQRGLSGLVLEEQGGSSSFLERLHLDTLPHVDSVDKSFQLFLKVLANGMFSMRHVYQNKKIRNIAWRFIPNHGRTYQKDERLRQEDLNALRNHHDLLSVIYYASPSTLRPSLTSLRNLADFKSSHLEVCKVNIRAWANLVQYQLSIDEPPNFMNPFVAWLQDMVSGLIYQHQLARTEAEVIANNAKGFFSWDVLESNVAENQRAVGMALDSIYIHLAELLRSAKNLAAAFHLFENLARSSVLKLHNASNRIRMSALAAYDAYIQLHQRVHAPAQKPENSEDSQDYGDLDIDDIDAEEDSAGPWPLEIVSDELWGFVLYNIDHTGEADDACICKAVDLYIKAASQLILRGRREWLGYLDTHGSYSWAQLPDSEFKRRFGPYFFAAAIQADRMTFLEQPLSCLTHWFCSLVERESKLKYQQLLTTALLNADDGHPILRNLPFARDTTSRTYDVALEELQQRRVGLVSSILCNIRSAWEHSFQPSNQIPHSVRDLLPSLLKSIMTTMKRNFLEIQPASVSKGAYVEFVHAVIELLQQHTATILPVDKFFTDSAAFPLPIADPQYIVGRLRSYTSGNGLVDDRSQKKLIMFLQTISDRAAADNQYTYLSEQLVKSVEGTQEDGALRLHFLRTLIPAYVHVTLENDCALVLTLPLLDASATILSNMLSAVNLSNQAGTHILLEALLDALGPICTILDVAMRSPQVPVYLMHCHERGLIRFLGILYRMVTAIVPFVDYVIRAHGSGPLRAAANILWKYIDQAQKSGRHYALTSSRGPTQEQIPNDSVAERTDGGSWQNVLALQRTHRESSLQRFAIDELARALGKYERSPDGDYVHTAHSRIVIGMRSLEVERRELRASIKGLWTAIAHAGPCAPRLMSDDDPEGGVELGPTETAACDDFLSDLVV